MDTMAIHTTTAQKQKQAADAKEIADKRAILEAEMEGGIERLMSTRRRANREVGSPPASFKGSRMVRSSSGGEIWSRRAKASHGALD